MEEKHITCPDPDRKKYHEQMKISFCRGQCEKRETCKALEGEKE